MIKSDSKKPPKCPKEKNQHIQVFVRVRPQSQQEKLKHVLPVVECPSNKEITVRDKPFAATTRTFSFDRVFNPQSKQVHVYTHVVKPLIEEVLAGYNCTVFAYGQTGTGKTYTMEGERSSDPNVHWEDDPLSGIIPRTLSHLFDELRELDVEFTVRVSFLELYNEELIDLLSPATDGTKLRIFEDVSRKGSVIIQGLEEITVHSKADVYEILTRGSERRQTAATLMNAHSSRSHTVFSITVHIKENLVGGDELLKTGKLNLVDLAGSENIGRSGAVDKRAREAGNINQSLLTLGRVITALVERAPHVPYRESKLTRLLQESLGGKTKTCFIATISEVSSNLEETLSTLDYAHRAKDITNRPEINQKLTKKELLKEYTEEIERLRRDLIATREKNGVFVDPVEFERMTVKMAVLEHENAEKYAHLKALREEMGKMQDLCSELNMEVNKKTEELHLKAEMLVDTEDHLQRTQHKLLTTEEDRRIKEHLVNYHVEKEGQLSEQAHDIMRVADQSTMDVSLLHDKLSRKRSVEEGNKNRGEHFSHNFNQNLGHMDNSLDRLLTEHTAFCGNLRTSLGELQDQKISELTIMSEHLTTQVQVFTDMLHGLEEKSAEAMRQAQYWIQSHLEFVRSTGTSEEDFRTSITELILSPLNRITVQLQNALVDMQDLSNHVNDEIRTKEYYLQVYSLEAKDAINYIEESVAQYATQRKQEIERISTTCRCMLDDSEADSREMNTQLQAMKEIVHRMEALNQSRQQRANISDTELGDTLNRCESLAENFSGELKKSAGSLKEKLAKHMASEKQTSEKLQNVLREFVEKQTTGIAHTGNLKDEAISGCWSAMSSNEEQWRQYCQSTEEQLQEHSEDLTRYLQSNHEQNQALVSKVRETAEVQESHLESQRRSFRSYMQERQNELQDECSTVRERGKVLSDELRKRQMEVNNFFTKEFVEDRPTGETPPRREYLYPRMLVASSPREIVIKRFQSQLESANIFQAVIQNLDADEKVDYDDKLSASTMSLPEVAVQLSSESQSMPKGIQKAVSESNVFVNNDSKSDEQSENQENLMITENIERKSRLREPQRRKTKPRNPLSQKNST